MVHVSQANSVWPGGPCTLTLTLALGSTTPLPSSVYTVALVSCDSTSSGVVELMVSIMHVPRGSCCCAGGMVAMTAVAFTVNVKLVAAYASTVTRAAGHEMPSVAIWNAMGGSRSRSEVGIQMHSACTLHVRPGAQLVASKPENTTDAAPVVALKS